MCSMNKDFLKPMIPEQLDTTITTAITIGSAALGLWAHSRQLEKERRRVRHEEKQRYADSQLKEYASERDFNHLKRNIEQLKQNLVLLHKESDQRLDRIERQVGQLHGALNILRDVVRGNETKNKS